MSRTQPAAADENSTHRFGIMQWAYAELKYFIQTIDECSDGYSTYKSPQNK